MLDIGSCVQIDENIYFTSYKNAPGLYFYNTNANNLQLIEFSGKHNDWGPSGYFRVAYIGKYVVCLPYYLTNNFLIYDIEERTSYFIPKKNRDIVYRSAVCFDGKLYMFPNGKMCMNDIAVFELSSQTIIYPFDNKENIFSVNQYSNVALDGSIVYLTLSENSQILRLDLQNGNYEVVTIGIRGEKYGVIIKIQDKFFLTGNEGYIYVWDGKQEITEIELINENRNDTIPWEQKFSGVVLLNKYLLFSPLNYPYLIGVNIEKLEVCYIKKILDKRIMSWGIDKLNDNVILNLFDIHGNNGELLLIYEKGENIEILNSNMLELDENIDLCIGGKEYSKYALNTFINNIVNGERNGKN